MDRSNANDVQHCTRNILYFDLGWTKVYRFTYARMDALCNDLAIRRELATLTKLHNHRCYYHLFVQPTEKPPLEAHILGMNTLIKFC